MEFSALQVIAGLHYNASMMLELLENTRFPDSTESVTTQFFKQWIKDAEVFMGYAGEHLSIELDVMNLMFLLNCLECTTVRCPSLGCAQCCSVCCRVLPDCLLWWSWHPPSYPS